MTTDTPPADPTIDAWSDRLEGELIEAGMEAGQARAYQRAFELGMNRVLSVMATKEELLLTKQELQKSIDDLRSELQRDIDNLRREMRFHLLLLTAAISTMFAGVFAVLGVILSKL